jgi:hypothetical protein
LLKQNGGTLSMELGTRIATFFVGALLTAAFLAGCGGAASGITPTGSILVPPGTERKAGSGQQLLYLSDFVHKQVSVYKYPAYSSESPYQTLMGFNIPLGECSNGKDLWIVDEGAHDVLEYEAGGTTPIATLKGQRDQNPFTCSYDPTTRNLAVANGSTDHSNDVATVMVYKHAKGKPKTYKCASIFTQYGHGFSFVGYDSRGDLFADAWGAASYNPTLCELPKDGLKMKTVALDRVLSSPGQIQWDGKHLAVGDYAANVIYQFVIKKYKAMTKGTISLEGAYNRCIQFSIAEQTVVCPTQESDGGTPIYAYPQGGSPINVISADDVWGTTIATMNEKR